MTARRSHWLNWSFIPGPPDFLEPFYSTELTDDIAEYAPAFVADAALRLPGVELAHAASPSWWEWKAQWTNGNLHITLEMTLFEVDPPLFGGFALEADCTACELLQIWNALRQHLPRLWLHSPDCRIYKPNSFRLQYLK